MKRELKQILCDSCYPDRAEFEWAEFEKNYRSAFGKDLPDTEVVSHLATLFGRSFYLAGRLINAPDWAERLFESAFLKQSKPAERFLGELQARVEPVRGERALVEKDLREYRYEEALRLSVRDTAGLGSFEELGEERSALAAACVEVAYQVIDAELKREYGQAIDERTEQSTEFAVLGMGKLGGGDLNYSSDIDLIYLYSSDEGGFDANKRDEGLTHHQYFVRLGEMLAKLLSNRTADGFVYRVDLDLRPEGKQGTLANSLDAMETYYESFGSNWERMALTKARPVAGSLRLGDDLLRRVRPFVYPGISDFSTLDQIRDLKSRIEQSLQQRLIGGVDPNNPGYNVKLGRGGIRDIEFLVGAFQRLYGGRDPDLHDRNTLVTLQRLVAKGLISNEEGHSLDQAYRFLRTVENRLQMLEECQTHALPKGREELLAFARGFFTEAMGPATALDRFQEQLLLHTENVQAQFQSFLKTS